MRKFKVLFILIIILFFSVSGSAQPRPSAPIQVGGVYAQGSDEKLPLPKPELEKEISLIKESLKKNDYSSVISRINTLVDRGNEDPRFAVFLTQAFDGLGRAEDTIYWADQAIAQNSKYAQPYAYKANALVLMKDYETAKINLDKAYKLKPEGFKKAEEVRQKLTKTPKSARRQLKKQDEIKQKQDQTSRLRWMLIYAVAFVLVIIAFWFLRKNEDTPAAPRRGKKIDIKEQYNFIRQIGEGGMGKVYEAYDNALKRRVAVKRVRPELVRSDYVRGQFLSEARMVALLRHPSIVEIYTVIETDNSLYLVFEYVEGQTLETRLDIDGYIPFSEAKTIFESICSGLQYAHSQDIIHCDLKPGNIMICDDAPAKVMDFGVAKKITEGEVGARTVAGTPAYMAPEQQKGFMKKQSDVFSLGVCLYEALVGQVPWSVAGFDIANKKIVPPSRVAPKIPVEVDAMLEKALKEDPKQRIQSIEEFWALLNAISPLETPSKPK